MLAPSLTGDQWDLVVNHLSLARYVAYKASRRPLDAEEYRDAALDGLIEAAAQVDRSKVPFRHWAAGFMEHRVIDRRRRLLALKRKVPGKELVALDDAPELVTIDPDPYESTGFDELVSVSSLDDDDREVLRLRFVEGLSAASIGRRLGVHRRSAQRLVDRLLKRLAFEPTIRAEQSAFSGQLSAISKGELKILATDRTRIGHGWEREN